MDAVSKNLLSRNELSDNAKLKERIDLVLNSDASFVSESERPFHYAAILTEELAALAPDGMELAVYPVKQGYGVIIRQKR